MKYLLIMLTLAAAILGATPATPQPPTLNPQPSPLSEPPELASLRSAYQQRAMRAMQPVNDHFHRQLRHLLQRTHAMNRLGDAIAVQHRLAALTGEDPVSGTPSDPRPAELETAEREYEVRTRNALAPVDAWYRSQLDSLQRRYTQRGDLAGAAAVQREIEGQTTTTVGAGRSDLAALAAAAGRAESWELPWGGELEFRRREIALVGPGRGEGTLQSSVAVLRHELGTSHAIQGEFMLEGDGGGFVIAYGRNQFVTLYWSRGSVNYLHQQGRTRQGLASPSFAWRRGTWRSFEITRRDEELQVTIDGVSERFDIPRGCRGTQFGLLTYYEPSTFRVRNLSFRQ